MNFLDFEYKVKEMAYRIQEKGINPTEVDIIHTKSSGDNIIAAIYGENIIDYFKW